MARTVLAAVAALALAFPVPASAAPGYVLSGSGTISPGHTLLVEQHAISFSGSMVDPLSGVRGCSYGGEETGSVEFSVGDMRGGCSGGVGCLGGPYVRVGAAWMWLCTTATGTSVALECVYRAHQILPETSYDLVCVGP